MRLSVAQIAQALVVEGKRDSARQILRKFDNETNEKSFLME
jgi:5S rRNA maturation endonuclease (ribonuclease M5)